ncbi:tumor necrosis factor alpha-induced protein 3-like [Mya arenaria]|uniref:tumor necrosis factor alpha-induced protein 3-like n=1 Tax=Mya arenaria TaxID=6604 RepID=UPI0022E4B2B7|nr:tumor necrosis factor alpha-induced protein 3-like [Mya arenaria]XP_052811548.1 tumor necrosis factor alpha-induced protein 3-like [Mya arenaria]XP_052811549.1 tumor necrosis factor alpha-induced protein 3-like [Mya arenaria]XP_052811550.1 tumor necrosis factor alpha-induced protein 3-like [Mya arenaria]XP_052811551.1 tumor necrosis factor alpha-induced protein 3-like [Mya arenaria]XP_052811552.1 tumor necrosis factor alpha-induced protein 3-like [Mya arenaria]XP_052811553.1 tumor necrosis
MMNDERATHGFFTRLQLCCVSVVNLLREFILKDVQPNRGDAIITLKKFNKYQIAIPLLESFSPQLSRNFQDAIFDNDMLNDLESSHIINWCRTTKKLYPIKTTADGNCLLHSVSQALWGIEDTGNFLRRLLYLNISMDPENIFYKRWLFNQQSDLGSNQVDVRLNTEQHKAEWENVKKGTEDAENQSRLGLPYETLEAIHLYVAANTLRRPIILLADSQARNVYGQEIQESHIGGIYLPLEIPADRCHKSPLVIGYSMNHFAPLVFQRDRPNSENEYQGVPLVTKEISMLPCRFLLPQEQADGYAWNLLQSYMSLRNVVYNGIEVPVAILNHTPLPESANVVDKYVADCRTKFHQVVNPPLASGIHVAPFNFQVQGQGQSGAGNFVVPPEGLNFPQAFGNANQLGPFYRPEPEQTKERCYTVGCKYLGDPQLQGLCSKCFKDFTIQYARQEEAQRQLAKKPSTSAWGGRENVTIKPTTQRQLSGYRDLSMMGENCKAGCGFLCSQSTFPYCHECYPKYQIPTQPTQPDPTMRPEFSLMAETCRTPDCKFRCSQATQPYCHECYEKHRPPVLAPPSAPPPSIPVVTQPMGRRSPIPPMGPQGMQVTGFLFGNEEDETQVVSLRDRNMRPLNQVAELSPLVRERPPALATSSPIPQPMQVDIQQGELDRSCSTTGCHNKAVRGNNGNCNNCYQLSLFGTATTGNKDIEPVRMEEETQQCANPHCDQTAFVKGLCTNCFLSAGSPTSAVRQEHPLDFNIMPQPEEKILNSRLNEAKITYQRTLIPEHTVTGGIGGMRSMPAEHDETGNEPGYVAPTATEMQIEKMSRIEKHICSTPGCQGQRIHSNQYGQCLQCYQRQCSKGNVTQPLPISEENLEESQTEVSCSPVELTRSMKKKLNPVVLSSQDKVKCSFQGCKSMIYPPRRLCEECQEDLERAKSLKTRQYSRELATQNSAIEAQRCRTPGCQFFTTDQFEGYCSSCYNGAQPRRNHTYPLATSTKGDRQPERQNVTAPLPSSGKRSGELCIEKGCQRYGDPAQGKRCSNHYQVAMSNFPPNMSAEDQVQLLKVRQMKSSAGNQSPLTVTRNQQGLITVVNQSGVKPAGNQTRITQTGNQTHYGPIRVGNVNQSNYEPMRAGTVNLSNFEPIIGGDDDNFRNALGKLENSRKSQIPCKNSSRGCHYFGNVKNNGYCNSCLQYRQ